jgi:hypothetical protein
MPAEGGHDRRMGVLKVLGQLFLVLAAAALGLGAWLRLTGQDLLQPAGQVWFSIDNASLNLMQAVIQRYIHPAVWDSVMVPWLLLPAWRALAILVIGFAVIGALLLVAARRRRRSFRR